MKPYLFILLTVVFLTGCKALNVDKLLKTKDQMAETRAELNKNNEEKLTTIATIASGTDYSLNKITNPPIEVKTAIDLNTRVVSIAGNPDFDELKKVKEMVDLLNSEVSRERQSGLNALREKDFEIVTLQTERKYIQNKYDEQIKGLEGQALELAKKADKLQVTVDTVNSWFGLGGVAYGLKRFVSSMLTGILIFIVLFIVLRFLSSVNPIAGAVFSIFEHIASYAILIIKGIVPKSIEFSNFTPTPKFDRYKTALDTVVDTLEHMKTVQYNSDKKYDLDDVFKELAKNLNDPEKKLIDELKTVNKYGE
ncbi:MAG: hypothetical protein RLZ10_1792 [Bacteroidota bacterium]|jgi:hypothetical protein